jgi:hypothetical protein
MIFACRSSAGLSVVDAEHQGGAKFQSFSPEQIFGLSHERRFLAMRDYVAAEVKRKLYEWRAEDAKAESRLIRTGRHPTRK